MPREQDAPRPATANRCVTLERRTVPSSYVGREHRTGAHNARRRDPAVDVTYRGYEPCQLAALDRPRSGDDDGAAHVENASVVPTQGHDQGDSTYVHLARRSLRRADGPTRPQDAAGWMEGGPEAGLLEQLELHIAPGVPDRRGYLHVLPQLLGDGTCLYDVADVSVRKLQKLGRR
jgi:hypothetical protein